MRNKTNNDDWSDLPKDIFDPWLFLACSACVLSFIAVLAWAVTWAWR